MTSPPADPPAFRAHALPAPWRRAAAALFALSRASLPLLLAAVLLAGDPPLSVPALIELVVALALLPGLAAAAIELAFAAEVRIRDGHLLVTTARRRVEIPVSALGEVRPWRVPLPRAGLWLHTRSGRRLSAGLALDAPGPFLEALAGAGCAAARPALDHRAIVFASARAARRRPFWRRPAFKFVAFSLAPAAVVFHARERIAYGDAFGQWQLAGPAAWLEAAALQWLVTGLHLLLFASVWRSLAEAAAWLAARRGLARASAARRAGEIACDLVYYLGVPALLAWRFLA
jgi:hypothetical protein